VGWDISRSLGYFSGCFLPVSDAVYGFEVAHWRDEMELWPSVKCELRWAIVLLPLLWVDLRAERDNVVVATDASEWGRGGVQMTADARAFASAGRQRERW
jgi:hypothetical protein